MVPISSLLPYLSHPSIPDSWVDWGGGGFAAPHRYQTCTLSSDSVTTHLSGSSCVFFMELIFSLKNISVSIKFFKEVDLYDGGRRGLGFAFYIDTLDYVDYLQPQGYETFFFLLKQVTTNF